MSTQTWKIGDVLDLLRELDSECIDTIITSPPYWGLRDYGVDGQIGLEPTLEEYLEKLLTITAELKRVLKKTGVMFWNHGDSYGSRRGEPGIHSCKIENGWVQRKTWKPKCLVLQNYHLVMRMVDEQGWILRNIIIWHKPNHMPSSVKDRFANAYEPVFMLTKSKKYYFDLDAVRVPHSRSFVKRAKYPFGYTNLEERNKNKASSFVGERKPNPLGKNPGDIWTIPTQPYSEAHFATFPEKLVEPMIKAACPKNGTVLDPFCGSGTVLKVARELSVNAIGFELNPEYEPLIRKRCMADTPCIDSFF